MGLIDIALSARFPAAKTIRRTNVTYLEIPSRLEQRKQLGDALAGPFLNLRQAAVRRVNGFRVNHIEGNASRRIADQTSGRIDVERGAYDDQDIGRRDNLGSRFEVGHRLAEEDDVRTKLDAVGRKVTQMNIGVLGVQGIVDTVVVTILARLHHLAVQVEHMTAAALLMEVVEVLRDDLDIELPLQRTDELVTAVGLAVHVLTPKHIVEIEQLGRMRQPRLVRTNLFDAVLLPESVAVTEGGDTALGTHAGTGQENQSFHIDNTLNSANIQKDIGKYLN